MRRTCALESHSLSVLAFLILRVRRLNEISIFKVPASVLLMVQVTGPAGADRESGHSNAIPVDYMVSPFFSITKLSWALQLYEPSPLLP